MARRRLTPAQPGSTAPGSGTITRTAPPLPRAAPIAQVAGESAEAAALRDVAHGVQVARDEGRMVIDVPLNDVSPGYLIRDRIGLDRDEMEALKTSIRAHGQRVAAEITPLERSGASAHRYGLISGWRRLSALGELYAETGEARFSTLRAVIRQVATASDSYVAMVEENEIRVGLSYFERARLVSELTRSGVFDTQSAALRTLFATASRAKRSKIGSFVELVDTLGDVLRFPGEIPERLGLALVSQLREGGAEPIRQALHAQPCATAADELAMLERLINVAKPAPVSRAKQAEEALGEGVYMRVQGRGTAKKLVLSGAGVDDALIARLRQMIQDTPG